MLVGVCVCVSAKFQLHYAHSRERERTHGGFIIIELIPALMHHRESRRITHAHRHLTYTPVLVHTRTRSTLVRNVTPVVVIVVAVAAAAVGAAVPVLPARRRQR